MSSDRDRWNDRWAAAQPSDGPTPPGVLVEAAELLPTSGEAIDLAGGVGDGAIWLAQRGFRTTLADVSDVALQTGSRRADNLGLDLHTVQVDLAAQAPPTGPWDLISCSHYLNRQLLSTLGERLAPGGILVVGIATTTNLERHERPSARFLLAPGELPELVGDLVILRHLEDWAPWGVHEARLVAQRPVDSIEQ